ncbi:hypothetical protein T492DRAFT_1084709 [Pavlovales sp. CCMP2436]|nr:hypothetical protein T492DRAFT_1084709 [Pavlovales sp. CCMP2436]
MRVPKVVGVLVSGEVVAIVRGQNVFSQTVGSVSKYEIRGRNTAACREARGAVEGGGSIPGSCIRARALVLGQHHAKLAVARGRRVVARRAVRLHSLAHGMGVGAVDVVGASEVPQGRAELQLGWDWPAYAATRLGARSRLEIILDRIEDHVERRLAHAVAQAELARGHLVHLPDGCLAVPPLVLLAPRLSLRLRRRCRSSCGRDFGLVRSVDLQGDDERDVRAAALCVHLVGLLDPERVLAPSRPEARPGP